MGCILGGCRTPFGFDLSDLSYPVLRVGLYQGEGGAVQVGGGPERLGGQTP